MDSAFWESATLISILPLTGGSHPAPLRPSIIASARSSPRPRLSPVDIIFGPSLGSIPGSLSFEKTGTFTPHCPLFGRMPVPWPISLSFSPSATPTARSTIGIFDILLQIGTVRLARGFASMIQKIPSLRTNCMFRRPWISSSFEIILTVSRTFFFCSSLSEKLGNTAIESPECIPDGSMCSNMPGMSTSSPSHTASHSNSFP